MRKLIEKNSSIINLLLSLMLVIVTSFNILLWQTTNRGVNEFTKDSQGRLLIDLNRDFFFQERLYKLRKDIEQGKPIFSTNGGQFVDADVEDYIGTFELVCMLVDKNILEFKLADDNFGGFVEDAWDNKEIKDFVLSQRKIYRSNDIYSGFEKWANNKKCDLK